jgi:cupin 2 domain-containing protein
MVDVVASGHGWRIEQILTGQMEQPIEDLLDHEEWVTVLAGAATLEIAGRTEFVETGDWLRLGPGVPHRVLSAEPGTSWLAVHIGPPESAPAG